MSIACDNLDSIRRQLEEATVELNSLKMKRGESLRDFEYRVKSCSDKILSLKIAEQVQQQQIDQEAREAEAELLKKKLNIYTEPTPFRIRGWRTTTILFLGGYQIPIVARFFARSKSRSEKGKGYYPGLVLFGILERLSPAVLDLLAKSAASLGSLREAQAALADQGIDVSLTWISTAVRAAAIQARSLRKGHQLFSAQERYGRKILVSIDGGRLRIRKDKKGKKTNKKRTRYSTDWREPKLLCIYFLNEQGGIDRKIAPILDGTMTSTDEIFKMLCEYLSMIPMDSATEVLFISDGADCLWRRVYQVKETVENKGGRFRCLLDYYHMKGYLYEIAKSVKGWTPKMQTQWINKMTKWLFSGKNALLEQEIEKLKKGSRKKSSLRTATNYLLKHSRAGHMNYAEAKRWKFPIGSGVIESTVRRVVNLRLKGASVYWKESNAEDMLLLRCLYKSNQWKYLINNDNSTKNLAP